MSPTTIVRRGDKPLAYIDERWRRVAAQRWGEAGTAPTPPRGRARRLEHRRDRASTSQRRSSAVVAPRLLLPQLALAQRGRAVVLAARRARRPRGRRSLRGRAQHLDRREVERAASSRRTASTNSSRCSGGSCAAACVAAPPAHVVVVRVRGCRRPPGDVLAERLVEDRGHRAGREQRRERAPGTRRNRRSIISIPPNKTYRPQSGIFRRGRQEGRWQARLAGRRGRDLCSGSTSAEPRRRSRSGAPTGAAARGAARRLDQRAATERDLEHVRGPARAACSTRRESTARALAAIGVSAPGPLDPVRGRDPRRAEPARLARGADPRAARARARPSGAARERRERGRARRVALRRGPRRARVRVPDHEHGRRRGPRARRPAVPRRALRRGRDRPHSGGAGRTAAARAVCAAASRPTPAARRWPRASASDARGGREVRRSRELVGRRSARVSARIWIEALRAGDAYARGCARSGSTRSRRALAILVLGLDTRARSRSARSSRATPTSSSSRCARASPRASGRACATRGSWRASSASGCPPTPDCVRRCSSRSSPRRSPRRSARARLAHERRKPARRNRVAQLAHAASCNTRCCAATGAARPSASPAAQQVAQVRARCSARQTGHAQSGSIGSRVSRWRALRRLSRPRDVNTEPCRPWRVGTTQSNRSTPRAHRRRPGPRAGPGPSGSAATRRGSGEHGGREQARRARRASRRRRARRSRTRSKPSAARARRALGAQLRASRRPGRSRTAAGRRAGARRDSARPSAGVRSRHARVRTWSGLAAGRDRLELVEHDDQVRAERLLDLDRALRRQEHRAPVERARNSTPSSLRRQNASSENTWKPPESVRIGPVPAHEAVQAAVRRDQRLARAAGAGGRCSRAGPARPRARARRA